MSGTAADGSGTDASGADAHGTGRGGTGPGGGEGGAPTGRVLVVDDDAAIRRSLGRALRLRGFTVAEAGGGAEAIELLARTPPDLLVLDISMPDVDGIQVCRTLRGAGNDLPVLVLSALDEVADRVAGLQAGADDYLVKPFALEELVLRLHALLRRRPPRPDDQVCACGLVLDPAARTASRDGTALDLTRREFELLEVLARNHGLVLTRDQLLDRVWGYDFAVRSDAVDTFVSYLRRKLEAGGRPRILHTVRGVGFVLRADAAGPDEPGGGHGGDVAGAGRDAGR
ncbi:response regulator transcription factor [Streptomyces sp. NBC_00448]|uniref:response regulator transcription factor n=1 Tax=Streptomyces sp. NBC_00448 TaxID=2903652 RepID=UPI002E1E6B4F